MKQKSGFTLVELSVVLIIIAAILGMTMTAGVDVISSARYSATISKMNALDQALMAFRTANDRIPCPADLSQTQGSATYGTEGTCTAISGGVFVAQNAWGTATAAEGGVPTAALGLPSDFMYDGWGNRFRYAVDTKMTAINAFSLMQAGCVNGAITVYGGPNYPATGNAAVTTGAIYALISHGANGHGGVTKNAVVTNAGSLNSDELTNCHCTSTGAASTYAPTYVQLAPYTYQAIGQANSYYNFDDIVSYKERWQMLTNWDRVGTSCAGGTFSRAITIDHTKVSTVSGTTLSSFPMLFSGTYSYLATQASGGYVANANGYDITFTSDAAGVNLLPFERESYNASNGQVVFWVQVPTVSATQDTTIYLWYDNPNITTDQSNKTGTWDSNYKAVWHMSETPPTGPLDSTATGANGTLANGSSGSCNCIVGATSCTATYTPAGSSFGGSGTSGPGNTGTHTFNGVSGVISFNYVNGGGSYNCNSGVCTFTNTQITSTVSSCTAGGGGGGGWSSSQQVAGEINGSLNFQSAYSDYITASNIHAIDNSSYLTIEVWANPTTLTTDWPGLVSSRSDSTHLFFLNSSSSTSDCDSRTAWEFEIGNGSDGIGCTASGVVSTGTWQFLVGVFDGTQSTNANRMKIYVNGVSQTLTYLLTLPSTTPNVSLPISFGFNQGSFAYYNGLMDEVRISNTARSADWIVTEYNNQSSPSTFYTVGPAVSR